MEVKEYKRTREKDHKSVIKERRGSYCAVLEAEITSKNTRSKCDGPF